MKFQEYRNIYNKLECPEDIDRLCAKGHDREFLKVLFTQKTTRDVKKNFYKVKNNCHHMVKDWKAGRSLAEIAENRGFPPILTAMMMFQEMGYSKKEFWCFVREPENVKDERIRKEIMEATEKDVIYSPWANDEQRDRGNWGEGLLEGWLDAQGVTYRTEEDLRGIYTKTPDCLFEKPMMFDGKEICWIESKATFGDNTEFRFNARKQLIPYTELFGPGLVVYWFGYLDDLEMPEGIYITDISILEQMLEEKECSPQET